MRCLLGKAVWSRTLLAVLLAATAAFAGCTSKGRSGAGDGQGLLDILQKPAWEVRPARMRIYPSTRIIREAGQGILEARVEFRDENGDPVKAVGDLRFELLSSGRAGEVGQRLFSWSVPMLSREQNATFYDPVTQAYLFRLKLESVTILQDEVVLRVTLLPAEGKRLEARALISPSEGLIEGRSLQTR